MIRGWSLACGVLAIAAYALASNGGIVNYALAGGAALAAMASLGKSQA